MAELRFKVSEKGGLSVYNLSGRFPVTLYIEQWQTLLEDENLEKLRTFMLQNMDKFKKREPKEEKNTASAIAEAQDKEE